MNFSKLTNYVVIDRFQINVSVFATFQTFLKEQQANIRLNVKVTFPKLLSVWQVNIDVLVKKANIEINLFKLR